MLDALFAPFPEAEFPRHLGADRLRALLEAPLAAQVPVSCTRFRDYDQLFPGLFVADDTRSADPLAWRLAIALIAQWPKGPANEFLCAPLLEPHRLLPARVCLQCAQHQRRDREVGFRPPLLLQTALLRQCPLQQQLRASVRQTGQIGRTFMWH